MNVPESDSRLCRAGCGALIVVAKTATTKKRGTGGQLGATYEDKYTPIDAAPSTTGGGNYTLAKAGDGYTATKITRPGQIAGLIAAGVELHSSHGKTCPKADEFMRKNRGQRV